MPILRSRAVGPRGLLGGARTGRPRRPRADHRVPVPHLFTPPLPPLLYRTLSFVFLFNVVTGPSHT